MTLIPHSFLEEAVGARSWRSLASRLGRGQRDRASRDEVALHVAGETVERDLTFTSALNPEQKRRIARVGAREAMERVRSRESVAEDRTFMKS